MSAAPAPVQTPPVAEPGGPWLGLQSYEERHSPLFFGRETECDELFRLVERGVLTVLYGVSGLGKTSLLNAGLFPKLREASYLPIPIRLRFGTETPDPISQLRQAVEREIAARCTDTAAPLEQETLWEFFHRTPLWNHKVRLLTPVLVFDQFEEVLTFGQKDARAPALFEAAADLVENYIPRSVRRHLEASQDGLPFSYDKPKVKVIFSLREDYLAELQDLRPLMPSLMRNCYRLKAMSGEQAREAVIGPARHAELDIADEVAERIVRIAAGEAQGEAAKPTPPVALEALEVEPVLLSLFCDELNKKRIAGGLDTITQELARGERDRILGDFYGRCMANETLEVRRYIEDDLLTKEGHRDTKAVENLPEAVKGAADRLINLRLLRREERLGRPYVELIHDVLAEPILASRSERHKQEAVEQEQRQRAQEREKLEQERQREREKAKAYAVAALICLVLFGLALSQWRQAGNARTEARALQLAAEGRSLASQADGWVNSALLATESVKIRLTPETSAIWAEAIDRLPLREMVHKARVTVLAFTPDGRRLATASADNTAQVWDLESPGKTATSLPHQAWVTFMAFSQNGRRLATASADNAVRVWDLENPTKPATSLPHPEWVMAVAFISDGRHLATASADNKARVWDLEGGKAPIPQESPVSLTAVAFSPDGKHAAGFGLDNVVRVWDVASGKELLQLPHQESVTAMAFSADGKRLATASADNSARVWDLESGREPIRLEYRGPVTAVAFSADGKRLATAHGDNRLRIWDAERGVQLMERESPAEVTTMAFSPDGKRLATAHRDNMTRLWALESATALTRLGSQAPVATMAFSPDEKRMVTVHRDNTARVWDLKSGEEVKVTRLVREGLVTAVAFSADSKRAATASTDNVARVWDVDSGKELLQLPHQESVTAMAFSADGKHLATASADDKARVWDLASRREPIPLPHEAQVTAVAFSPDGRRLATGSADKKARVWDWESGKELIPVRHQESVTAVAFSSDGRRLATASADNKARVWDLESRKEPTELIRLPHRVPIRALAFGATGERMASIDADHVVRVWPLNAHEMIRVACALLPRNLNREERSLYLRDERHPATCQNLPED